MYTRQRAALVLAAITMLATPMCAQSKKRAVKHASSVKLKWGPAPPAYRPGAQLAVISGDPGKEGPFVVQLSFPAGFKVMPHFHPVEENVTVKSGTMLVGMGETMDEKSMSSITPGNRYSVPAKMHHYAMAKGNTIVEVHAMGPFTLTYVNPSDDPRITHSKKAQ